MTGYDRCEVFMVSLRHENFVSNLRLFAFSCVSLRVSVNVAEGDFFADGAGRNEYRTCAKFTAVRRSAAT